MVPLSADGLQPEEITKWRKRDGTEKQDSENGCVHEYGRRKNDSDVIFTPHLGEFSRIMKYPVAEIKRNIIACCKLFTKSHDVSLVCKDARTVVAKRGKLTYLNSSGNDGMATAGSGDVLTGIIAGLLAQGLSGFEA